MPTSRARSRCPRSPMQRQVAYTAFSMIYAHKTSGSHVASASALKDTGRTIASPKGKRLLQLCKARKQRST